MVMTTTKWYLCFFLLGAVNRSAKADTWGPRQCFIEPVNFKYNDTVPYTYKEQENGEKPFNFSDNCYETQECLGIRDDILWNLRTAGPGTAFLIFENILLPDLSPANGQSIVDNAQILFDNDSVMHIEGVGTFFGATGIGSYLAIPHQVVSGIVKTSDQSRKMTVIDHNRVVMEIKRIQQWTHLGEEEYETQVRLELTYYPCSIKIKAITMELTPFTLVSFTGAATASGAMENVCTTMMDKCTGPNQQYESYEDCLEYMKALPTFDPICQHKIGPMAVQGNSYMCKYLHQFMTPFEPEVHCFHAGKGRLDPAGKRKCVPTECLSESTPLELRPNLLPPDEVTTSETYFENLNGTFVETLFTPYEVTSETVGIQNGTEVETIATPNIMPSKPQPKSDAVCSDAEAEDLAAATVLTLPFCMASLNHGSCYANCTQAVQTYLGRFAENGAVCRCNNGINGRLVMSKSAMLTKLRIDAKVLLEFCSRSLAAVEYPDCLGELDSYSCPLLGTYRGSGACYKWDYMALEKAVRRDWGKEAQFRGRITTSDTVASAECSVLAIWAKQARSDEQYYTRYTATGNQIFTEAVDRGIRVHPSLDPVELGYEEILSNMSADQIRNELSLMSESCYFGSMKELHPVILDSAQRAVNGEQQYLYPPIAYSTGSELHRKTRALIEEIFPGLWGTPEPGHTYTDILDNVLKLRNMTRDGIRNNLVKRDIESLIREVAFRAMLEDELPYIDEKLGDDLDALNAGALFRPDAIFELQGGLWPTGYMAAKYQLRRHLQTSGVLTLERMEEILDTVGLNGTIAAGGVGGAYDFVASGLIGPASTQTAFSTLIERFRWDECEVRQLWDEVGGKKFLLEHLRLNMDVPGFIAKKKNSTSESPRMYQIHSAHLDPKVFEDPLSFNPKRPNLHQSLFFNGLEKDFETHMTEDGYVGPSSLEEAPSLRRWCPGRHISLNLIVELAPLFFPPETDEYHCHGGMRARYGVEFTSELIQVETDQVELEVLKADGKSKGENLMILLGGQVDAPLGWSMFIANMRKQRMTQDMHYWVLTMPGWGGKGTRIEQYTVDLLTDYIVDLIRHAKKSYKRVFLFGRGIAGVLSYYVADKAGKENLYGFLTHTIHPAVHALANSNAPASGNYKATELDPMADLIAASDMFPFENFVKNDTWWDQAWEWDFRSFQKKTGGHQFLQLERAFYALTKDGRVRFVDFGAANELDPDMHMLTIGHEFSLFYRQPHIRHGLFRTTPKRGTVQKYKEVREKPNIYAHFYRDGESGEELAEIVHSFVDQSIKIRFSLWNLLKSSVDFSESSFKWEARNPTLTFYIWAFTIAIMLTGFIAEITLGKVLVLNGGFAVWLFAQVFAAIINFGCFLAADPITIPLYTMGLFKLGFPEVTLTIIAPFTHPEFSGNNKAMRALNFLSGVAYVIHHTGGTLVYMVVTFQ